MSLERGVVALAAVVCVVVGVRLDSAVAVARRPAPREAAAGEASVSSSSPRIRLAGNAQGSGSPHGEIGFSCADCHTTEGWRPLRDPLAFDHGATGYALIGNHVGPDCADCHESLRFAAVPTACADCHADVHRGEMGFQCGTCHAETGWSDRRQMYIFHFTTAFPLLGGHASVDCEGCHRAEPPFEFSSTPTDCASCHAEDYRLTVDPDHVASGFATDCESCHTIDSWRGALIDEHDFFRLEGGHAFVPCASCHPDTFAGTPTDCFACHAADYRGARDPDHEGAGFSTDCQECHTILSWDTEFDHDPVYPLLDAHARIECEDCHAAGYSGTPTDCYGCHAVDYDSTTDPDHAAAGFPTDCEACHDQRRWMGAVFDHDTAFELVGRHRRLECDACHTDGYAGTARDCYGCHAVEYESAVDPDHSGYPLECEDCHDQRDWTHAIFDHDDVFRLQGAHRTIACESCHVDGYVGTPTDCLGCHAVDYREADDPDHEAAGFPRDCEACHDQRSWQGAVFDHDTVFRLEGAHRSLDCESCHVSGYADTPTDCYSCHVSDLQGVTDPDHDGFPRDCEACHDQAGWGGAVFDHDTVFRLEGAHRSVDCASCHAGGYAGTPTDCYACHTADYRNTTDPDHQAAGFPTDCDACHGQDRWEGAVFDHRQFFPIDSGAHADAWNTCADCHVQPGDFGTFECILCHEHSQSQTDDDHDEVDGYQWISTACYSCHPQGREDD